MSKREPAPHWYNSARFETVLVLVVAVAVLVTGVVSIQAVAEWIVRVSQCGYMATLIRFIGLGVVFVGTAWLHVARRQRDAMKGSTEEQLRRQISELEQSLPRDGVGDVSAQFRKIVGELERRGADEWKPEHAFYYQSAVMELGVSLMSQAGVPNPRASLYRAYADDDDGPSHDEARLTRLDRIAYQCKGMYRPGREVIKRSTQTEHMFGCVEHPKVNRVDARGRVPADDRAAEHWRSAACHSSKSTAREPYLISLDSTVERAFDSFVNALLELLLALVLMADAEQARRAKVSDHGRAEDAGVGSAPPMRRQS